MTLIKDDGNVYPFSSGSVPASRAVGAGEAQAEGAGEAAAAPPMERTLSGLRCEGDIQTWCLRLNEFSANEVRLLCVTAARMVILFFVLSGRGLHSPQREVSGRNGAWPAQ